MRAGALATLALTVAAAVMSGLDRLDKVNPEIAIYARRVRQPQ